MDSLEVDAARQLTSRIRALAVNDDYRRLLEIEAEPDTTRLLDLLSNDLAAAARVHLEAAGRWKRRKEEANRRRLQEARSALDAFDLPLTRALLSRIEQEWLQPEDVAGRDEILLLMEARSIESEELSDLASEAVQELRPQRRGWKKRRNRKS